MELHGQGIQNSGIFNVAGDINIATTNTNNDTLLKIRLTDPLDDKARIEEQKGGLLYDSYKWIFKHENFQKWRDGEGNQHLWIRGDPGKGKTMLLCGIIDELNKAERKDWNIAYYFCQATDDKLNKATCVLRGLIFSLLSLQPRLLECVREQIDESSGDMFQDANGWAALCRIFRRLMEEIEKRKETACVVVDALDECMEGQDGLLRWIASLSSSSVKVLVSSRNWPSIESGLANSAQSVSLRLELNVDCIKAAVESYIDAKARELAESKKLDVETREAIQRHLKSNSGDTFLWISLVCEKLNDKNVSPWNILNMLREFPSGLNELYGRMAGQFLASRDAEICCRVLAVQTVAYRPLHLTELFPLAELPENVGEKSLPKVVELCGSFLTLRDDTIYFVHQSAKDYLIRHKSDNPMFDCYLRTGHQKIFVQSIDALSRTLQENIYRLPSPGSCIDTIVVSNPDPLNEIRYACVYWADHLEKMESERNQSLEDGKLLHGFLANHLLHWLEALSLLKSLGSGIGALTKVLSLLRKKQDEEERLGSGTSASANMWPWGPGREDSQTSLHRLAYDAMRLSRTYRMIIETAPLQVYGSVLAFSPTLSVVRRSFPKPEWLLRSPTRTSGWGPCLQTLGGHKGGVLSMSFSSDSRLLVSGSSDSTARVWDMGTGNCLTVLTGHRGRVISLAFSPSSQLIASHSTGDAIRIWNTATGACQTRIESVVADERCPSTLAFPSEGCIVTVDRRSGLRRWDVANGTCLQQVPIGNVAGMSEPLYFSASGRAAWISQDRTSIGVTEATSGRCYNIPCDLRDGPPNSLVMSADGKCVAVVQDSRLDPNNYRAYVGCHSWIRVWNVAEGTCMGELRFQGPATPQIKAWSSDCRHMVVQIHDEETLECEIERGERVRLDETVHRHQPDTNSNFTYSPDGRLLALTGRSGSSVSVWETATARQQLSPPILGRGGVPSAAELRRGVRRLFQSLSHPRKPVVHRSAALSPGGELLATIDVTGAVEIRNTTDDKPPRAFRDKGPMMQAVENASCVEAVFSPDNRHVAIQRGSSAVQISNAVTGRVVRDWVTDHRRRDLVSFSVDGSRLLVAYSPLSQHPELRKTVEVVDIATGTCLATTTLSPPSTRHHRAATELADISADGKCLAAVEALAFSPDGTKVFTATGPYGLSTYYMQTWDLEAGSYTCAVDLPHAAKSDRPLGTMAFSPDGKHVTYVSECRKTNIVHVGTGALLKSLDGFWDNDECRALTWNSSGLTTNRGVYATQALLNDPRDSIGYGHDHLPVGALSGIGISKDRDWILKNGEPYICIPPHMLGTPLEKRTISGCGNAMAFGSASDNMYCIRFPSVGGEG